MKKLLLSVAFVCVASITANAQTTLSQTGGVAPTKGTVACAESNQQTQQFIRMSDNAYFRAYTMAAATKIISVKVGVGSVQGNFPLTVTLYKSTGAFPGSFATGLTQLATKDATFTSANDLKLVEVTLDVPVAVASGDIIVAKIHHGAGVAGDGKRFYMGIAPTETASAYMLSTGCQINTPTVMTTINAEAKIIIDLVENANASSEQFFAENFNMYPNPATDVLNISSKKGLNASEVRITDMTGKVVRTQKDATTVNVSDLSAGTYLIDITTKEGKATSKFIKK
ncbi:T9SS type A sorting domain-containing protein [Paenimyroides viscosum]|uniref:T9SS C-terminal target domain-containing protein n=1 Tax=Paenimyroides viscosum TaxID=2488729 RepID=A0A3P1B0L7_9FLAO|nr:T9SS type A sorting domain-containing protein [Paenimyroides viscosum]RRA94647.1 T9SS C-terminal target domain-containing protein [Paenimyroides viscosum]